uniref:Phosphatidylserine synthase n=1 Tax=Macrostomum lignano TaxID=282301 RepID=A0A1I8IDS3_9PLAT
MEATNELNESTNEVYETGLSRSRQKLEKSKLNVGDTDSVSKSEEERCHFAKLIENHKVDNITIEFFYKPHTLSLLFCIICGLIYLALGRTDTTLKEDVWHGSIAVCTVFLIISILVMPNGPFIRPHPAIWRVVFGISVLYFLVMVFVCFLSYEDARRALVWMYPDLANMTYDDILDKEYAANCSEITLSRLYSHLDVFAVAHLFGWVMKAVLLRHYGLTWLLSINWEITEMAFSHILPNFQECWWDIVILDVFVCNGVGIFIGMQLCRWLEMRSYHWESIRWTPTRWLDPESSFMRVIGVSILVVLWQIAELNCFFLKHIFIVRPGHVTTMARLALISTISAPGIRQYYLYVTDPLVTRVGTQLWLFVAIVITEAIVCLKFGRHFFERTVTLYIVLWVIYSVLSSFFIVFLCVFFAKKRHSRQRGISVTDYYLSSDYYGIRHGGGGVTAPDKGKPKKQ